MIAITSTSSVIGYSSASFWFYFLLCGLTCRTAIYWLYWCYITSWHCCSRTAAKTIVATVIKILIWQRSYLRNLGILFRDVRAIKDRHATLLFRILFKNFACNFVIFLLICSSESGDENLSPPFLMFFRSDKKGTLLNGIYQTWKD